VDTEPVFPLQTILFQSVFLLVAIALEARIFHRRLRITRKTSVEYATSINLLCAIIGWLTFFAVQNLLPQPLRAQIISYIFFDRFVSSQIEQMNLIIVATGIGMFFSAFFIKLIGLRLLDAVLNRSPQRQKTKEQQPPTLPRKQRHKDLPERIEQAVSRTDPGQAATVLLANAYSHSAILLLLFLRFLQFNNPLV